MKLRDYLKKNHMSIKEFAKNTGLPYHTVYSWLYDRREGERRIPGSKNMRIIIGETKGKVKANDFY
jgi:transposase